MIYIINGGRGYVCVYLIFFYCIINSEIISLVYNDYLVWVIYLFYFYVDFNFKIC